MLRQRVTTDQDTTSVYPRLPHGTFQNLCQVKRLRHQWIRRLSLFFQIRILLVSLLQRDLRGFRHHLGQPVGLRQIQLQHPRHVLDCHLGRHTTESHDVRHLIRPVFLCNPLQHPLTSVIIEVDVNIRQRDTIGIQKTLEQQIILHRVNIRDTQAIRHGTPRGRTTSRSHDYPHIPSRLNKILHDQEVSRETHRLHDMQLENQTLHNIRWNILPITPLGTLHRQLLQIIRLQLDTVKPVISPQLLHFLLGIFLAHNDLTLLVTGKLVKQILLRESLPVLLLRTDLRRDRENRHQRVGIQFIFFNFINNLLCILYHLRNILEQLLHLGRRLEPLLPRVTHPVGIIQILAGIQTNQQIMRLGILRVQEMHVVRGNHLDPQLLAHTQDLRVTLHLIIVNLRPLLR